MAKVDLGKLTVQKTAISSLPAQQPRGAGRGKPRRTRIRAP